MLYDSEGNLLTCETCDYWDPMANVPRAGFCHRHAPPGELNGSLFNFCKASVDDWCGEHSALEWRPDLRELVGKFKKIGGLFSSF